MKIMFVCHGNICRSPMAEFIFRKMLTDAGRAHEVEVASSATSTEEIGNSVYPPAKAELWKHGISCEGKRAVQLTRADYEKYEMFICMDLANVRNATRIFGADPDGKIVRLMDLTERGGDVADPWYTDRFDIAYRDIEEGCRALISRLFGDIKK